MNRNNLNHPPLLNRSSQIKRLDLQLKQNKLIKTLNCISNAIWPTPRPNRSNLEDQKVMVPSGIQGTTQTFESTCPLGQLLSENHLPYIMLSLALPFLINLARVVCKDDEGNCDTRQCRTLALYIINSHGR